MGGAVQSACPGGPAIAEVPAMDPTAALLRDTLLYLLMPLWLAAGFADWCCHKVQRIEQSAGLKEALLHWLMLTEMGLGLLAVLLLEVNAAVLLLLLAACAAHELTTWWDLLYASSRRRIGVVEQWVHSFQLLLPWTGLVGLALLHAPQALAVLGLGAAQPDWQLRWKQPSLPPVYLGAVAAAALLLVLLPFAEELLRCRRVSAASRRSRGAA